jgi:signal peptidase I
VSNEQPGADQPAPSTQPAPGTQPASSSQPATARPLGCLIEIVETLVLTIVIFWVIQTFVAQPYKIQQESMHGTLEPNQYVLVDKLTPHFDGYSRGDIVVFNPIARPDSCSAEGTPLEAEGTTPYIKRVIGEPGDHVELRNGAVWVNGVQLNEPYTEGRPTQVTGGQSSWIVPADRLFVMGDNRPNSADSRQFGPICISDVIGRAWVRYWPLDTLGILQTPTYDVPPPSSPAPSPAGLIFLPPAAIEAARP